MEVRHQIKYYCCYCFAGASFAATAVASVAAAALLLLLLLLLLLVGRAIWQFCNRKEEHAVELVDYERKDMGQKL